MDDNNKKINRSLYKRSAIRDEQPHSHTNAGWRTFSQPTICGLRVEIDILQLDRVLESDINGQCLAILPQHRFMDLQYFEEYLNTQNIYISPDGVPYPSELQYQAEKQNYDNYRLNGGTRTLLDWKANLGNDRLDLHEYDEYLANGGKSSYESWDVIRNIKG